MKKWACILFVSLMFLVGATKPETKTKIDPSSAGPAPTEEAGLLWKEANDSIAAGEFNQAVLPLQRLINRHPADQNHTTAHRLLGSVFLQLHKPEAAVKPLRFYVNAMNNSLLSIEARLLLARAYLDSKKPHEAFLLAKEAIQWTDKAAEPQKNIRGAAFLTKSEAQMLLKRDSEAKETLAYAAKLAQGMPLGTPAFAQFSTLRGYSSWLHLALKARECSRLPGPGRLNEGQARDQLERRGSCMIEGSLLLRDVLFSADPLWSERGTDLFVRAVREYAHACQNPPTPPGKRTAKQLKQYRMELVHILEQDMGDKYTQILNFIATWKEKLPRTMEPQLNKVVKSIQQTIEPRATENS